MRSSRESTPTSTRPAPNAANSRPVQRARPRSPAVSVVGGWGLFRFRAASGGRATIFYRGFPAPLLRIGLRQECDSVREVVRSHTRVRQHLPAPRLRLHRQIGAHTATPTDSPISELHLPRHPPSLSGKAPRIPGPAPAPPRFFPRGDHHSVRTTPGRPEDAN